jgi:hypothetical protein
MPLRDEDITPEMREALTQGLDMDDDDMWLGLATNMDAYLAASAELEDEGEDE